MLPVYPEAKTALLWIWHFWQSHWGGFYEENTEQKWLKCKVRWLWCKAWCDSDSKPLLIHIFKGKKEMFLVQASQNNWITLLGRFIVWCSWWKSDVWLHVGGVFMVYFCLNLRFWRIKMMHACVLPLRLTGFQSSFYPNFFLWEGLNLFLL